MRSVLNQMIAICDFLKTEVCDKIELYIPPVNDVIDDAYIADPKRGHPEIFPLTFDSDIGEAEYDENGMMISASRRQAPAICVLITDGSDVIDERDRTITVRLVLQSWNPGTFTKGGLYVPHQKDDEISGLAYSDETKSEYIRNFDGWRESLNFLDVTLKAIEQADTIADMQVVRDEPINFGQFTYSGEFVRMYPYWLNEITFKLKAYQVPFSNTDEMLG